MPSLRPPPSAAAWLAGAWLAIAWLARARTRRRPCGHSGLTRKGGAPPSRRGSIRTWRGSAGTPHIRRRESHHRQRRQHPCPRGTARCSIWKLRAAYPPACWRRTCRRALSSLRRRQLASRQGFHAALEGAGKGQRGGGDPGKEGRCARRCRLAAYDRAKHADAHRGHHGERRGKECPRGGP